MSHIFMTATTVEDNQKALGSPLESEVIIISVIHKKVCFFLFLILMFIPSYYCLSLVYNAVGRVVVCRPTGFSFK